MNQKKFRWMLVISMSTMLMACSVGVSIPDQEAAQPSATTPAVIPNQSGTIMDSKSASAVSSSSTLNSMLKPGMAYADFRKVMLGQDWMPMADSQCKANVVGANYKAMCADNPDLAACRVCDQLPELSACSGDGYCLMKFQHAGKGEMLEATSYGMIEDWNVSGEDSRLQILRWALLGSSES